MTIQVDLCVRHVYAAHMQTEKPIGYWVKLVDELLETDLERSLDDHGISRRHWQILNVVESNSRAASEVAVELSPFLDSAATADSYLRELVGKGWLQTTDGSFELTGSGQTRLRETRDQIRAVRARIAGGVTEQDYTTTLLTLKTMCRNLGWEEDH